MTPPFFVLPEESARFWPRTHEKNGKILHGWRHSRRLKFQKYHFLTAAAFLILISNICIWYIKMTALASSKRASGFHPWKKKFQPFLIFKIFRNFSKFFFKGWKPDALLELAKAVILMYQMLIFEIRIENAATAKKWYFWNFKRRMWRHPRKIFPVFSWILGQNRALFPGSTKKGGVISRIRIPYWNSSSLIDRTFKNKFSVVFKKRFYLIITKNNLWDQWQAKKSYQRSHYFPEFFSKICIFQQKKSFPRDFGTDYGCE